jgi:hypothetical protein
MPDGSLEGVDETSGEVVWRQKPNKSRKTRTRKDGSLPALDNGRPTKAAEKLGVTYRATDENGKVWEVPNGMSPDQLPRKRTWPYNDVTANNIIEHYSSGKSVTAIGRMDGYPCARTIFYWLGQYPEFKRQMDSAKKIRAEFFADKVITTADDLMHEDDAPVAKVKIDAYKWGSKVNDPDTYGDKLKHSGDASAPLGFVIMTGVPDPEPIEVPNTVTPATTALTSQGGEE